MTGATRTTFEHARHHAGVLVPGDVIGGARPPKLTARGPVGAGDLPLMRRLRAVVTQDEPGK